MHITFRPITYVYMLHFSVSSFAERWNKIANTITMNILHIHLLPRHILKHFVHLRANHTRHVAPRAISTQLLDKEASIFEMNAARTFDAYHRLIFAAAIYSSFECVHVSDRSRITVKNEFAVDHTLRLTPRNMHYNARQCVINCHGVKIHRPVPTVMSRCTGNDTCRCLP